MTAIVAVVKNRQTWVGSDGRTTQGNVCYPCHDKFIHRTGWSLGHTGLAAAWDVIENSIGDFKPPKEMDRAGAFHLAQWIKRTLQAHGVKKEADDQMEMPRGPVQLILATNRGKIFQISTDGHVSEHKRFWAGGSGQEYMIGALDVLHPTKVPPRSCVEKALEIAVRFNPHCGRPLYVHKVA